MSRQALDLDSITAFLSVVELGSFSRAAESLGTTQAAISLKLKRLEERLGCRLVERTPRYVEISKDGSVFLEPARKLLEAHERALRALSSQRERITIGISDHVAGPDLATLIARMNLQDPELVIEIRIGSSGELLQRFDRREIDTVIVRFPTGRDDGKVIAEEPLRWFASPDWHHRSDEPLPIASMADPCGVRLMAYQLLDDAGWQWSEIFVGGGVSAVSAAVMAGLGIAALAPRMLPLGAVDIGQKLGLPLLPRLPIMLHTRVQKGRGRVALNALVAAFKSTVRG